MFTQEDIPYRLSHEAQTLKRSVMRELLRQAAKPGVISLAGGLPDTQLLPAAEYQACVDVVLARDAGGALQYRPMYEPLREWVVMHMASRGVTCTPDEVFITNGNQQGLSILSRVFMDAGDPAVIEDITFTGVQQATIGRGAHIYTVPTDLETGIDTDALESVFASVNPRLAVIIPGHHNPLGVSISDEKRARLAALAAQYHVPIIEDDPYSMLRFEGTPQQAVKAYDRAGYVFYLGSFSKMLAPGLRLGWLIAPRDLMPKITIIRESLDLESSTLTQRAVYEFLQRGGLAPHLTRLNAANAQRCAAMLDALDTHLSDLAHWTMPDGGLFVWLTLPAHIDTWVLAERAIHEAGVAFVPGGAFDVHGGSTNCLRLNFSAVNTDSIREGVARLAALVHAWV